MTFYAVLRNHFAHLQKNKNNSTSQNRSAGLNSFGWKFTFRSIFDIIGDPWLQLTHSAALQKLLCSHSVGCIGSETHRHLYFSLVGTIITQTNLHLTASSPPMSQQCFQPTFRKNKQTFVRSVSFQFSAQIPKQLSFCCVNHFIC